MSEWIDIDFKTVDVNKKEKEVTFYVKSDDNGNIYACLTFDDIKRIYDQIQK